MITALLSQKGGVGKTTLALHLAQTLSTKGRTLLLDCDPQGSAMTWLTMRETAPDFAVVALATETVHRDIDRVANGYDFVVIDGPPRSDKIARSVMMASDRIIIPMRPAGFDLWASDETANLVREIQVFKPGLSAAFVMNCKVANTAISRSAKQAFEESEIPLMRTEIASRVAVAEATTAGLTVFDTAPASAAAKEIKAFCDEVIEIEGVTA
jgi:chromosome partitioning protein